MRRLFVLTILLALSQMTTAQEKTFQWIGGPTMVIHLGSFKILTDPMLSPKSDSAFTIAVHPTTGEKNARIRRLIAPADFDKSNIDLLLVSHPHADHIDKEARAALSKDLYLIGPEINKEQIAAWGYSKFKGLNWTESTTMRKGDESLTITAVEARHAAIDPLKSQLGKGNGYIIEYKKGKHVYRIYWTGDTVWFDAIADVKKYGDIDLLVSDMGSVGSDGNIGRRGLNAEDCLHIAEVLNPREIIPVHHSTFSMYIEPVTTLQKKMDATTFRKKLRVLETGEIVKL